MSVRTGRASRSGLMGRAYVLQIPDDLVHVEDLLADTIEERLFFLPVFRAALLWRNLLKTELLQIDDVLEPLQRIAQVVPDHRSGLADACKTLCVAKRVFCCLLFGDICVNLEDSYRRFFGGTL